MRSSLAPDRRTAWDRTPADAAVIRKSLRRSVLLLFLALGMAYVGFVTFVAFASMSEARSGRDHLIAARTEAGREEPHEAGRFAAQARSAFVRSASRLQTPLVGPLRRVPILGANIRVADALAQAGIVGADAADVLAGLAAARAPEAWVARRGRVDLRSLDRVGDRLELARRHLRLARVTIESSPSSRLWGTLAGLRARALHDVSAAEIVAERGATGLALARRLLGAEGPRRYFLAFGSLSELRGTGGLIGFAGVLTADRGSISFEAIGKPYERLPAPSASDIRVPHWYAHTWARYGGLRMWQNINASTDFPTVGSVIAQTLRQRGSLGPVDGVVQIDPVGLEPILRSTGPITVASWTTPIDASNVSSVTQHEAYIRYGQTPARVAFLADLATAVFARISGGQVRATARTLAALGRAADGGHIQMYAVRRDEQKSIERLGLGRAVNRSAGATDVLGVVTENWSPSKIDWFLRRSVRYEVRLDPSRGVARSRLRFTLKNLAPASGLPELVAGSNDPGEVPPGHNRQLVAVLRRADDQLVAGPRVNGRGLAVSSDSEAGLRAYTSYVTVGPRARSVVDASFDVIGALRGRGPHHAYSLHVLRQPVAHSDEYSIRIHAPKGWRLVGTSSFDGPLDSDVVMNVALTQTTRARLFEYAVLRPLRSVMKVLSALPMHQSRRESFVSSGRKQGSIDGDE